MDDGAASAAEEVVRARFPQRCRGGDGWPVGCTLAITSILCALWAPRFLQEPFNIETFAVPLREWVETEQTKAEIMRRFVSSMDFGDGYKSLVGRPCPRVGRQRSRGALLSAR